jgi:hypothetical protein
LVNGIEALKKAYLDPMAATMQTAFISKRLLATSAAKYAELRGIYIEELNNMCSIYGSTASQLTLDSSQIRDFGYSVGLATNPLANCDDFFALQTPRTEQMSDHAVTQTARGSAQDESGSHDDDYSDSNPGDSWGHPRTHEVPTKNERVPSSSSSSSSSNSSSKSPASNNNQENSTRERSRSASTGSRPGQERSRSNSTGTRTGDRKAEHDVHRDDRERHHGSSRSANTTEDRKRPDGRKEERTSSIKGTDNRGPSGNNTNQQRSSGKGSGGKGSGGKGSGAKGKRNRKEGSSKYDSRRGFLDIKNTGGKETSTTRTQDERTPDTGVEALGTSVGLCSRGKDCKNPMECQWEHTKEEYKAFRDEETKRTAALHQVAMDSRLEVGQKTASTSEAMAYFVATQPPYVPHNSPMPSGFDPSRQELPGGGHWKPDPNDKFAAADKLKAETQKLLDRANRAKAEKARELQRKHNQQFAKATAGVGLKEQVTPTVPTIKKAEATDANKRQKR